MSSRLVVESRRFTSLPRQRQRQPVRPCGQHLDREHWQGTQNGRCCACRPGLGQLPEKAHHRRAWLGLVQCFSSIERVLMRNFSEKFNSSLPRYDVLTAVALTPQGLTMGELARMLMVTKGNITGVVNRLKQDGLVRKATSKTDRRIQSVTISAKGRRLWDTMHADYDKTISEILSGKSKKDLQALTQMLEATRLSVQEKSGE